MSFSFTRTREELAALVLRKLGVLGSAETAVSADLTIVYEAIDMRLKEMHRQGIFWRKVEEVPLSFTIAANGTTGSASSDVLFPIAMHVLNGTNDDPVTLVSPIEYAAISNKAEGGVPVIAMHNGGAIFTFWPVPTASTTAKLLYEKIADDTATSTAPDVDVAMLRWLKDIIAFDLMDEFGIPETKALRWMKESERAGINIRKLTVPRVDYLPVAVDDWDGSRESRTKRDWNTG